MKWSRWSRWSRWFGKPANRRARARLARLAAAGTAEPAALVCSGPNAYSPPTYRAIPRHQDRRSSVSLLKEANSMSQSLSCESLHSIIASRQLSAGGCGGLGSSHHDKSGTRDIFYLRNLVPSTTPLPRSAYCTRTCTLLLVLLELAFQLAAANSASPALVVW